MKINTSNFNTHKTALYFHSGSFRNASQLVIVLHGYGQTAEDFISNFLGLQHKKRFILAPEALNRFYLSSGIGKIGASWMTSRDRKNEIKDYLTYLELLIKETISYFHTKPDIYIIGFSQGSATALRWAMTTKRKIKKLVLWSGSIAPDINWESAPKRLNASNLTLVVGKNDKLFPYEQAQIEMKMLKEKNIQYEVLEHNGKHEIEAGILMKLFSAV